MVHGQRRSNTTNQRQSLAVKLTGITIIGGCMDFWVLVQPIYSTSFLSESISTLQTNLNERRALM
jgi:hypothetical protein